MLSCKSHGNRHSIASIFYTNIDYKIKIYDTGSDRWDAFVIDGNLCYQPFIGKASVKFLRRVRYFSSNKLVKIFCVIIWSVILFGRE